MGDRVRVDGPLRLHIVEWTSHRRRLETESGLARLVTLRTFHFPGWSASLDGEPVEITAGSRDGEITLSVPPGRHSLEIRFGSTAVRQAGQWISALSLLGLAALAVALPRLRVTEAGSRSAPPSPAH